MFLYLILQLNPILLLADRLDEAKDTLEGVYELSKVYENELYGGSYKGKCQDQASRLEAINKGALVVLRALGCNIEENILPLEVDPNQMNLFESESKNEK